MWCTLPQVFSSEIGGKRTRCDDNFSNSSVACLCWDWALLRCRHLAGGVPCFTFLPATSKQRVRHSVMGFAGCANGNWWNYDGVDLVFGSSLAACFNGQIGSTTCSSAHPFENRKRMRHPPLRCRKHENQQPQSARHRAQRSINYRVKSVTKIGCATRPWTTRSAPRI